MALPQRHVAEDSLELTEQAMHAAIARQVPAATAVRPHRRGTRRPQRHLEGDVVEDRERTGVAEPGDARPPRFGRRRAGHLVLQGARGGARRTARSIGRGSGHRAAGHPVGHRYQLLGSMRGAAKRIEPVLVTLTESSEVFPLFQHIGTEFIYMLSGRMTYGYGAARYLMRPGDALEFEGDVPHGPVELTKLPITFLSIIATGALTGDGS